MYGASIWLHVLLTHTTDHHISQVSVTAESAKTSTPISSRLRVDCAQHDSHHSCRILFSCVPIPCCHAPCFLVNHTPRLGKCPTTGLTSSFANAAQHNPNLIITSYIHRTCLLAAKSTMSCMSSHVCKSGFVRPMSGSEKSFFCLVNVSTALALPAHIPCVQLVSNVRAYWLMDLVFTRAQ